jgi:hypothetical protein
VSEGRWADDTSMPDVDVHLAGGCSGGRDVWPLAAQTYNIWPTPRPKFPSLFPFFPLQQAFSSHFPVFGFPPLCTLFSFASRAGLYSRSVNPHIKTTKKPPNYTTFTTQGCRSALETIHA